MADSARAASDFQIDFSGGANGSTHTALLQENEVSALTNCFPKLGGGIEGRGGYKLFGDVIQQGTTILEMEQSTGTILTREAVGDNWYDETMSPRFQLFIQTPNIQSACYFGAREKFFQLILYLVYAYVPGSATQGLVYEYFKGGSYTDSANWVDFTASVVAATADDKKLAVSSVNLPREIALQWPDLSLWAAGQIETRTFQYWIRIRVTVDVQNGGSDVVQGQRRVRGDWVGRRHLITADTANLDEWPGLTLTARNIDTWPTGQKIPRINAAMLNDHLYYASSGQRPLQRWNGSRGVTRSSIVNNPANAGLTAPTAAPTETRQANSAAYGVGLIIRARIAFEYGPEGILGESPPSPSREIAAAIAAGGEQITWNFSAAVTQASSLPVNAIVIYATYDLSGTTAVAERDRMGGFLPIKRVLRDDANWIAGTFVDTFVARLSGPSPVSYTNTPPFYPKYVVGGGERLWIANEIFVAWSDIGRGDSWKPSNIKQFPSVQGIAYEGDHLVVWHERDISYIRLPANTLPDIGFLWRGEGCVQPDTITIGRGEIHFVSDHGPARLIGNRVELTGAGRAWEDGSYWNESVVQRRLASAAYFEGRVWFGIDSTGAGPGLTTSMAVLSLLTQQRGAWSRMAYYLSPGYVPWATLGVVHCPLDHELARKRILCGFADATFTSDFGKLAVLEYGTTDKWTTLPTDGTPVTNVVTTRAVTMRAVDRMKEFIQGHILFRQKRTGAAGTITTTVQLVSTHGRTPSKVLTFASGTSLTDLDFGFLPSEASGGGRYRETSPTFNIVGVSDTGWELVSWMLKATIDDFRPL